jgi:ABC-type glycerol-3-phosphate transport system permease component
MDERWILSRRQVLKTMAAAGALSTAELAWWEEPEESALIDGCGRFGALCRVVLPLAAPGVAATAIFAFVTSGSELLFMVGQYETQWGQLSAGVIISTVPVAILFTYLQRHLIRGLAAGALKG